jgi:hypothetical protein
MPPTYNQLLQKNNVKKDDDKQSSLYKEPSHPMNKREKFDEDIMRPLLMDTDFNKSDRFRLSNYNKHRIGGSKINVTYKFGIGCEELQLGRLFPEGGIGLQSFRFDMRNPLAKKHYWDTDIDNCDFKLALKFCQNYEIVCEKLQYYINNREECLALVSSSRKKAKNEFLKILYGGNVKLYCESFNEVEGDITEKGYQLLADVKNEVTVLMEMIWIKFSHLHKLKAGGKVVICKKPNPKASLMAIVFQTEERKMLMVWDCLLTTKGRYLAVFIHDGGYVEKLEGEIEFPPELLVEGA